MAEESTFHDLMIRLRAGDQDAATEIYNRFTKRLVALARSRLNNQLRQKVDPEEIIQSVYRSFFNHYADGQFNVNSWDSLWGLLAVVTVRKCGHRTDYFRAARRDVRTEVAPPGGDLAWEGIAREPTPSEAAILAETVEQMMRTLNSRHRDIVSLHLQGRSPAEISSEVGCTERTVQRVMKLVRAWLERRNAGDGSDA